MNPYDVRWLTNGLTRDRNFTRGRTWKTYLSSLSSAFGWEYYSSHDEMYRLSTLQFKKLLLVPGFVGRFHKSELELQKTILSRLSDDECKWSLAIFLKLVHETKTTLEDVTPWIESRANNLSERDRMIQLRRPSSKFESKAEELLHYTFISESEGHYIQTWNTDYPIVLLLALKYGESTVTEIIDLFISNKVKGNFYDFTQIVENWKKLKDYPMEWTMSAISTHKCVSEEQYKNLRSGFTW